ncbi:hypothetical protein NQ318_002301 [Aromia moschata]|uniref:Glucose-methanol-choline oxidoreductase N-terminal domain-containing protein n=1 Tax=Aromia moschata TaxID=1265417 RepID=A0AAV8Z587_9CUCU|nr:hypothetical protein NQ318_002301 [Aromia moschata]
MRYTLVLVLTFAILEHGHSEDHIMIAEKIFYAFNNISRLFEKYVLRVDEEYWKLQDEAASEYDFIIVGGGSAGCVVACRLSEVSNWRVLLLEAGEPENIIIDIPALAPTFQKSKYDWAYRTVKQEYTAFGLEDGKINTPRGKVLGGSSSINFMMYIRGNIWDYEQWEAKGNPDHKTEMTSRKDRDNHTISRFYTRKKYLVVVTAAPSKFGFPITHRHGCQTYILGTGWGYKDVLRCFIKSERARLNDADPRYHGLHGYLALPVHPDECHPRGGPEMNLPLFDFNAPNKSFGVGPMQSTTRKGRRETSARAFLRPTTSRKNLDIVTEAFVTKILIDDNKKAYGVLYEKNGKTHEVKAKKEVILSAGAINTPQLLMLSGIGPKEHLEHHGIKCLKDLPVGKNLMDHPYFYCFILKIAFDLSQMFITAVLSLADFILHGTGLLTTIGGIMGVGFVKTNVCDSKAPVPDIEFMFIGGSLATGMGGLRAMGIKPEYYKQMFGPLETGYQWTIAPVLLHPKSVGYVKLNSTDPHDPPLIDPRYFSDPDNCDMRTMIGGIREAEKLINTTAFRKYGAELHKVPMKGCDHHVFDSDGYWECALRSLISTLYHPVGTAKMGKKDDPTAVVDHRLKVHGVKALRVIDVSVMPVHIAGHPNAAAMMIGEMGSDYLKQDWLDGNKTHRIPCDITNIK